MPLIKVSVTKQTDFQGHTEEFSNVYTFSVPSTDEAPMKQLISDVAAAEKPAFGTNVTYTQGYAFVDKSIAGWLNPRLMYAEQVLSGSGSAAPSFGPYKECAFLVKWPLPRKVTDLGSVSRKRQLMKYLHSCAPLGGGSDEMQGGNPLVSATVTALQAYATRIEGIANADLCSQDGALPSGPAIVHPYLEHRQFPRGRKEGI